MQRHLPILILIAAAAAVFLLFLTVDPLGIWTAIEREEERSATEEALRRAGPELTGRPGQPGAEPTSVGGEPVGSVDLGKGRGVLTGLVTGAGAPLAHARVVALVPGAGDRGVRSRTDGTWEVHGLPPGRFDVRASAEGFRSRTVVAPELAEGATAAVEPIDLTPAPPLEDGIEVKVTDSFGRPIAGAKVLATTLTWSLHLTIGPELAGATDVVSRTAATDAQGTAAITKLPPNRYDVVVIAAGWQTAAQSGVWAAAGRTTHLLFRLEPGVTITGTLVDPEDRPVKDGYVVGLHQPSFLASVAATTEADGSFRLEGLREGRYMIVAGHPEHGEVIANQIPSPSAGHRLQLSGAGAVEIQVVTPDEKPVTSYRVRPYQEAWFGYTYSLSWTVDDAEGRYRFSVPPGTWHLLVQAADGSLATAQTPVSAGETARVRVVLPATGVVKGAVVDPEGNHLPGAEVYVRRGGMPPGPSREQYARTDEDGRFTVKGLPLERTKLHVRHARFADTVFETEARLASEAPESTVRMSAGGRIEGRVAGPDGRPVADEQVNVVPAGDWFDVRTTRTDSDGSFAFEGLAAGTYSVATGPWEQGGTKEMKSGLQVPPEGTLRVEFTARGGAGSQPVSGVVRHGGRPAAGATVYVSSGTQTFNAVTDGGGAFEVKGVPVGRIRIYVQTKDTMTRSVSADLPPAGLSAPIEIEIGTTGVRGVVVSAAGVPVSGAWVEAERPGDEDSSAGAWTTTALDGAFHVAGLDAGQWRVRVTANGYATLITSAFPLGEGDVKDLGRVSLSAGAALSGRVTDDAGAPLENATISLEDSAGRPVFSFSISTTGSDGRYRVPGLKPGDYSVKFQARGYATAERPVNLPEQGAVLDAVLARGGRVRARVEDLQGQGVAGARVTLVDAQGRPVTRTLSMANLGEGELGVTDAQGTAVVPDLAAGVYRVSARKDGAVLDGPEPSVSVAPGGSTDVRLVLRPAGG